jgi:Fic family protein
MSRILANAAQYVSRIFGHSAQVRAFNWNLTLNIPDPQYPITRRRHGRTLHASAPADTQFTPLNRVLDGRFEGKLTNAKWAALGKCSADTALRDINDLLARGVLRRLEGGGRSTGYELGAK